MAARPHLLVAGAGPAGALLAYVATRAGVRVTLIERHPTFDREFRGEVVMPGARQLFESVGLDVPWRSVSQHAINDLEVFWGRRRIRRFSFRGPSSISQPGLLEMLVRESAGPNFELRAGESVRDVIVEEGRVRGLVTEEGELRADFVVAADGRFSTIRRRLPFEVHGPQEHFDVIWCRIPDRGPFRARAYLGGGRIALVVPTHGGGLQFGWVIPKGSFGDLRKQGFDAWFEECASFLDPALRDHALAQRAGVEHPTLLSVVCDCVGSWTRPGLMLIGDAAHAMSPVGAQGINMAIRDAVVTANHLVAALGRDAGPDAYDAAARAAEAERRPEIEAVQRMQRRLPRTLFGSRVLAGLTYLGLRLRIADVAIPWFARRFAHGVRDVVYEPPPAR